MNNLKRVSGGLLLLVILALSLGTVVAQDDDYKILRARLGTDDVPTLDPAIATDASSIQVLNQTYIGLTVLASETLETQPGLAESWEVTDNGDGTFTYTFNLMQEVPWVHYNMDTGAVEQVMDDDGNVRYVTAADVVYGWQRTLDPETAGDYAYLPAAWVVNGEAVNAGEADVADIGVEAVDEYTVAITAESALPFQPSIYGLWMVRPMPQWIIEEAGEFWQEPENFQSYGPYTMSAWDHAESLTLVKNPFWPGTDAVPQPAIDEIQFLFLETSVALAQFEAGELDHMDSVPNTDIPRIQSDPVLSEQYSVTPSGCSYYYGFNTRDEPTSNVNLRLALSYAVDRQAIVENVTQGGQIPAQWFVLPSMVGAPSLETHPDLGVWYSPELAQEHLALALEELGYADVSEVPQLTLLFNTNENHARIAEAIQQMWADELGLDVQLTNQEFATYLDTRAEFPVWRAGWCLDYPDAHNFLYDVFHSSSNNNDTWWTNEEYDALLEQALTVETVEERRELYAQAEQILVKEEAAMIPIYWYTKLNMTAPGVERTFSLDNAESYFEWDINR